MSTPAKTPATQEENKAIPKELPALAKTAQMVGEYSKRLVGDEKAQQFVATLLLMAKNQPKIAASTPESLGAAMMACVHLDLMPNTPAQYAFVIPYLNGKTKKYESQFQIGYKGLVELAYRSGQIKSISAEVVFPTDKFKVELGTKRKLTHVPDFNIDRTDSRKVTHVYATVTLLTGEVVFEVMGRSELDKVQKTAKAASSDAPWASWWVEMAKKTVVKRILKLLPSSSTDQRLSLAAAADSWAQGGKLALNNGELVPLTPDEEEDEQADTPEEEKKGADISEESLDKKLEEGDGK